ncbi:hypothetical protein TSTA_014300 [Talaromyces stipitatus ATCC 10500]|uniref:Uncharacterized protein n=1 Tax=Talaromyces stipitatus (strain ATCC 10500 / CBS 375.48 / QM 6759 / NRRL 1006) TaxID=441959 RepID=B8MGV8_TALSN|nr:uncharacterized protein TSTA_014300 [Talaromyces stipitatus ATCC 10500]EED16339.1 hypothetical protein TSTA_014300 [Talaromyces stipitatus ATCC 10500]
MASNDRESTVVPGAEVIRLLEEIKKLLKTRNHQLESSSVPALEQPSSALNKAVETSVSQDQSTTSGAQPSGNDNSTQSSIDILGLKNSSRPNGPDRTKYYEIHPDSRGAKADRGTELELL